VISPERSLGLALDPCLFFQLVVGSPPDPGWQTSLLRSDAKRIVCACARQQGKSAAAQTLAAHEILFGSGSGGSPPLVIICAPSLKQSTESARKVFEAVRLVEPDVKMQSLTRLETSRGARCLAMPSSEGSRGLSRVSLCVMDEASRILDTFVASVSPALAVSDGRLILLSTPFGKSGFFFRAWNGDSGDFERYSAVAADNKRVSKEFLEQEKIALGFLYPQEYENIFLDGESQLIPSHLIEAARWESDEKPWL